MDSIVLVSISRDEIKSLIKEAVQEQFSEKKQKELISFKEVIELLGISPSALNNYMKTGKVPFSRLGKRIIFNRTEVLAALKESNFKKLRDLR